MKQRFECLAADESVQAAARRMRENHLVFMPVCDESLNVLGTVTDRDLAIRVVADQLSPLTPVGEIMATDVVACSPGEDVRVAERLMGENHRDRILCVDSMGRLCGIVSLPELARHEDATRIARTFREVTEREVLG